MDPLLSMILLMGIQVEAGKLLAPGQSAKFPPALNTVVRFMRPSPTRKRPIRTISRETRATRLIREACRSCSPLFRRKHLGTFYQSTGAMRL